MWVGTGTGIYLITSPLLGAPVFKPMKVAEQVFASLSAENRKYLFLLEKF
jgi:hypothetical protein